MIKRILVALDPDPDTPIATRYAIRLARRFDATLTGLALIDMGNIHASVGTGGIGTIYYAEQIREYLTEETRTEAKKLLDSFNEMVAEAGIEHATEIEEGVPYERIIEELKYHDLLVLGRDSHFFYSRPEKETKTLANVIKKSIAPSLIVTENYREIERVMVAVDESGASARTLQSFVHLLPYGKSIDIELVNVVDEESKSGWEKARLLLGLSAQYLKAHGFEYVTESIFEKERPGTRLLKAVENSEPDLVLLGAHSMSAIKRATLGSTTYDLITKSPVPLFVNN